MGDNRETVLITGGSGMIGQAIKKVVNEDSAYGQPGQAWVFLSSTDGDLIDKEQCEKIFDKYKPTLVVHLAAKVGGLFANLSNNLKFFRENMAMNDNVLQCCLKHNVKKVISCTSTCIFPDKTTYPIDETMIHLGPPHESNMGYAYAKRMLDVMSKLYHAEHGCLYTTVVPCNVFGPYDNFSLTSGHSLPALIHKCYVAKKNDTELVVLGSGTPLRQFIYSIDLAKLILWALYNYEEAEPIILAVDEQDEVSIGQLAQEVAKVMDLEKPVVYDRTKSDGQYKKTATNAKMRSYLPDFKFTPLSVALKETVDWFADNYETLRK